MPSKKVDLADVQKIFSQLQRKSPEVRFQSLRCPRKCKGRAANKGQCTPANCTMLHKKKVAINALRIARNPDKKKIVRSLNRNDKNILKEISGGFRYRNKERKVIKKQLESVGKKMPRLKSSQRTWEEIFHGFKKLTGRELSRDAKQCWRNMGKRLALKNLRRPKN